MPHFEILKLIEGIAPLTLSYLKICLELLHQLE